MESQLTQWEEPRRGHPISLNGKSLKSKKNFFYVSG